MFRIAWKPLAACGALLLGACALQPEYSPAPAKAPAMWSEASPALAAAAGDDWWTRLGDPAVDTLVASALADNPTLAQALARLDEARAVLGVNAAQRLPSVTGSAGVARERVEAFAGGPDPTMLANGLSAGPSLAWELDLFGRVRESVAAASGRLAARNADAAGVRLSLAADVASGVLGVRACEHSRHVDAEDIASREKTLGLTRLRVGAGFEPPVDEARALAGLAAARTNLAAQSEVCVRGVNALVYLSGQDAASVRRLLAPPLAHSGGEAADARDPDMPMPSPPPVAPMLPAALLAGHPGVLSAEREAAAAWADIGAARADRLPRIDLAAMLTGQWLRAGGSSLDFATWSIGPAASGTLFDGGAGAANVSAAEARYRAALANLQLVVRGTVQEVENALAAMASADERMAPSRESVRAAHLTLVATEAQWRVGAVSLFELEDARRQFAAAQDSAIAAARDRGQAWVALVKASGNAIGLVPQGSS